MEQAKTPRVERVKELSENVALRFIKPWCRKAKLIAWLLIFANLPVIFFSNDKAVKLASFASVVCLYVGIKLIKHDSLKIKSMGLGIILSCLTYFFGLGLFKWIVGF